MPRTALLRLALAALTLAVAAGCTAHPTTHPTVVTARPAATQAARDTGFTASPDTARPPTATQTPQPSPGPALTPIPGITRPTVTARPHPTTRTTASHRQPSACPTPARTVLRTTTSAGAKGKTVALTFDDGPGRDTPAVLAILARHHIHATFFQIGRNITAHPDLTRQVAAAGHALGNHTYDHPLNPGMDRLPATVQATQIDKTTRALHHAAPGAGICYFRAPGGNDKNPTTLALARTRGMTVVNWAYDPRDWAAPNYRSTTYTAHIIANATGTKPHPIVLMHDGGGNRTNTVAALDAVITYYAKRGYTFTTPDGHRFPSEIPPPTTKPKPTPRITPHPNATAPPTGTPTTPGTPAHTPTVTSSPTTTTPTTTP